MNSPIDRISAGEVWCLDYRDKGSVYALVVGRLARSRHSHGPACQLIVLLDTGDYYRVGNAFEMSEAELLLSPSYRRIS